MSINIAVDGPSGAGKSSLSKALADRLGYIYVDTGAIYRCVGLYVLRKNIIPDDPVAVGSILPEIDIRIEYIDGMQHMILCGSDVSDEIRFPEVSMYASKVSALPVVRNFLLEMQRRLARENNCIMDGRDIGTVVLPTADVKIFLSAAPEERARRRFEELKSKGMSVEYTDVLNDMIKRDAQDTQRAAAPLMAAADAISVDTSGNSFEESLELIYGIIAAQIQENEA